MPVAVSEAESGRRAAEAPRCGQAEIDCAKHHEIPISQDWPFHFALSLNADSNAGVQKGFVAMNDSINTPLWT
jgi:hypothetical protein